MEWKRPLLIGVGWGIGTALGLVVLGGAVFWYTSRPTAPVPPKPWDATAIKAEYDAADTEGNNNDIAVYYTLENTTAFDYRTSDATNVTLTAKLLRQNELSISEESPIIIDYPIFVPAKKRMRFRVHLNYPYPVKQKSSDPNLEERKSYRAGLEKYMSEELGNLDGFDLLDESSRYEIIFPAGWKHSK
jgi:hypothetical protein